MDRRHSRMTDESESVSDSERTAAGVAQGDALRAFREALGRECDIRRAVSRAYREMSPVEVARIRAEAASYVDEHRKEIERVMFEVIADEVLKEVESMWPGDMGGVR